jgi:AraC-like DNA-binding protein
VTATSWSTDTVKPRETMAFWREAVCATVVNVTPEAPRERFRASISGRNFGPLRFASFSSTRHSIVRDARHADRAGEDHYLISLQRRGRSGMSQAGRELWLEQGEIGILDGTVPFRVTFPTAVSRVLAVVPRRTLDLRAPWLRRSGIRRIAASSPFVDLAKRHIRQLAGEEPFDIGQAQLLTDNLCNLLALATAADAQHDETLADARLQAILAFCSDRLGDADLTPQKVATHFRISVRTLHLRFEAAGKSFGRWLLEQRLEASDRALRDPAQRDLGISEIAFRFGFGDLSHFSRTFRARFGNAPRDVRRI